TVWCRANTATCPYDTRLRRGRIGRVGEPTVLGDRQSAVQRGEYRLACHWQRLPDSHVASQLRGQRCGARIADAARHNRIERAHVRVAVEFESVHRDAALYPDSDSGDFAFAAASVRRDPHPATALDPATVDAEPVAHRDQGLLQQTNVGHHVDRVHELDNRVPHELSRAVPRDPPTPVHIHHGRAVHRPVRGLRALTSRVHRRVFQEQQRVTTGSVGPLVYQLALQPPGFLVIAGADIADIDLVFGRPARGSSVHGSSVLAVHDRGYSTGLLHSSAARARSRSGCSNRYPCSVSVPGSARWEASAISCAACPSNNLRPAAGIHHGVGRRSFRPRALVNVSLVTGCGAVRFTGPCTPTFVRMKRTAAVTSGRVIHGMYCFPEPSLPPSPNMNSRRMTVS